MRVLAENIAKEVRCCAFSKKNLISVLISVHVSGREHETPVLVHDINSHVICEIHIVYGAE